MAEQRTELFSCRMTVEQRMMITRLRGQMEALTGERVLVADVVAAGLVLLIADLQKKKPVARGA